MRVIVEEPIFKADVVRAILDGTNLAIDAAPRPWAGDDVVGLLVWQAVGKADMERLPNLRAIVTASIGVDHIDLAAARRRGIWVCNVPEYCVEEVAESTIGLIFALLRGIVVLDRSVRDGLWDDHAAGPLPRIAEARLGIVGFGRIGRAVAKRARALQIETWATDPLVSADAIAAADVRPATLDDLLAHSTVISLHAPATTGTSALIGVSQLARMPTGSYLINVARGSLIDLDAVIAALDAGRLAGAALDVLGVEPPTPSHPSPRHSKLIVTPHAAWYSAAAEREVVRRSTLSLRAVMEGRQPEGLVVGGTR